ncbi:hypothetical protein OUZ56_031326 [Daphnia magna]|uniref:Uncharacterized protein n=1 Tax=Daphnia magna TaxID=35525 RepID=A0ABQ9ZV30_9CRUS|nr:hypothetical protein OUZ56_031326 [Daphnia magna]
MFEKKNSSWHILLAIPHQVSLYNSFNFSFVLKKEKKKFFSLDRSHIFFFSFSPAHFVVRDFSLLFFFHLLSLHHHKKKQQQIKHSSPVMPIVPFHHNHFLHHHHHLLFALV